MRKHQAKQSKCGSAILNEKLQQTEESTQTNKSGESKKPNVKRKKKSKENVQTNQPTNKQRERERETAKLFPPTIFISFSFSIHFIN
jgi:hypothetical protein